MSFLKINNLSVDYKMRKETVYAAKNVNIDVNKGEILGLVGESGSGKSTVGNAIINLIDHAIFWIVMALTLIKNANQKSPSV